MSTSCVQEFYLPPSSALPSKRKKIRRGKKGVVEKTKKGSCESRGKDSHVVLRGAAGKVRWDWKKREGGKNGEREGSGTWLGVTDKYFLEHSDVQNRADLLWGSHL